MNNTQQGSTFVELIVIVSVVLLVVTGLVSSSVASLRGASSNTLKSQATKYAQEGLELARKERDTSWYTIYQKRGVIWCVGQNVTTASSWTQGPCLVNIDGTFTRSIGLQYLDNGTPETSDDKLEVTSTVSWKEGANTRTSTLQTYLTDWR